MKEIKNLFKKSISFKIFWIVLGEYFMSLIFASDPSNMAQNSYIGILTELFCMHYQINILIPYIQCLELLYFYSIICKMTCEELDRCVHVIFYLFSFCATFSILATTQPQDLSWSVGSRYTIIFPIPNANLK